MIIHGARRVGYALEVGRSVRTAGGAGAYCVATRTACITNEFTNQDTVGWATGRASGL